MDVDPAVLPTDLIWGNGGAGEEGAVGAEDVWVGTGAEYVVGAP